MVTQPTLHSDDFCTSEAVSAIPLLSKQTSRHTLYPMSNSPSKSSGRNPSAKRRKIRIFPHLLPPASFTAPALLRFPRSLRRPAVSAAARRSESKGARRCSALLAGWLWLAWPLAPCRKMGSVPASVSGQRPTETERGAADCGRPPHAHTCTHTRADCGTDTPRPRPRRRTPTDTPNGQGTTTWALARRAATGRPKLEISGRRVRFLGVNKAADVSNNPGLDLIIYDSPYSIFRIEES